MVKIRNLLHRQAADDSKVWVLHTDSTGELNARIGVAEKLGYPYEVVKMPLLDREDRRGLQRPDSYDTLGYLKERFSRQLDRAHWPEVVITSGMQHSQIAYDIKQASGGRVFIVGMQDPKRHHSAFDLIAIPDHKPIIPGDNVVQFVGVPHKVTPELLDKGRQEWGDQFSGFKKPMIAVLVGGSTNDFYFTVEQARELGRRVREMALKYDASVVLSNSRRTPPEAMAALTNELHKDDIESYCHDFYRDGGNPYFGLLALADYIVVTGDSMSMCSEASATGKPTYIYAPDDRTRAGDKALHENLYKINLARPFNGELEKWDFEPLDTPGQIAEEIKKRLALRREALIGTSLQ